jgi:anaerobic ribonucleoside-triphosphate reductase activating protein
MDDQIDYPLLNIAKIAKSTTNLGPGNRSVVWVMGCPHHCTGCIAPEWLPFEINRLISPTNLAQELLSSATVTGITFSGGEPMAQAAGLAAVVRLIKAQRDVDIICFSGYRHEQLMNNPPNEGVYDLLGQIDVLIDGLYIRSMNDGKGLRGSSNQRIIHLTNKLKTHSLETCSRKVEVNIDHGQINMIGIPSHSMRAMFDNLPQLPKFDQSIRMDGPK